MKIDFKWISRDLNTIMNSGLAEIAINSGKMGSIIYVMAGPSDEKDLID